MTAQLPAAIGSSPPPQHGAGRSRFAAQHRRRLLRADLLTVVAWASVAAAVALWLSDGALAAAGTPSGAVTAAGVVAGLVGMDLVLLMLLLAARTPWWTGPWAMTGRWSSIASWENPRCTFCWHMAC
ncbi:hypothetical protein [Arthrobacter ulcerisalmonis]|uniref:hypothetical protein n=1 Tax=Arthrobacter ulcerisalmonis TaxID=2483813 RepID=UPI0036317229